MELYGDKLLVLLPLTVQVSIVGIVRKYAPFVTNIQYSVDDMTGPPLCVKQWLHEEASSLNRLHPPLQRVKTFVFTLFVENYWLQILLAGLVCDPCSSWYICEGYWKPAQFLRKL